MKKRKNKFPETLKEAVKMACETHGNIKAIAESLGISASTLHIYTNIFGDEEKVIPSRYIIPLTRITGDSIVLEFLCRHCGYAPLKLPDVRADIKFHLGNLNDFIKKFSKTLNSIATAYEDDILEKRELLEIKKYITELVMKSLEIEIALENEVEK